ncbi:caspase family protein [Priestia megaterium]|uniref:caspase family protein n=1 Tax=Priestia megaterium TaxID=1404 RepID=UPI002E240811|nr:caspase family protein [Priestia megaterium]MED4170597.1 caspase family protein [Priestia megaterium]
MSAIYRPTYSNSWALIIGINKYKNVGALSYACNDANGMAKMLKETYHFPEENVCVLLDEEANKTNIMKSFLEFSKSKVQVDDRIIVFYAGHGHTIPGNRGDIGYLIPYDASLDDLSTLIRWDELTRNAELIRAKHILYIMDACYSGLAITRSLQPGSVRFLKDMLRRNSRQVITAGKANQAVADANGPLPGHSIFTGHLLQALQGNASKGDDIITANGVMSYVYEKVSNDIYSDQTPHYGFLEGDGDFIFKASLLTDLDEEAEIEKDYLVEVPAVLRQETEATQEEIIDETKEYLTDEKFRIKLDDLVNQQLRKTISSLSEKNFPLEEHPFNQDNFVERLENYEQAVQTIRLITSCITHWGEDKHVPTINKILTRLVECNDLRGGIGSWLSLRWYPVLLIMYSGGISALARNNYEYLAKILTTKVKDSHQDKSKELVLAVMSEFNNLHQDPFKMIPEHARHYVPRSEYLYKLLQPDLDDLLFLGKSYDELFDRFEIFFGLVHSDLYSLGTWGPVGRFGWKYHRSENAYNEIIDEAKTLQQNWPPIKAGLFGGSYERFKEVAEHFREHIVGLRF